MRRIITITAGLVLAIALLTTLRTTAAAQNSAFGKTLSEWQQLYFSWYFMGGPDHVGQVKFLAIPAPDPALTTGSGTYDDPQFLYGHLDVTLASATPFVLPVIVWIGETYLPATGYPDDPPLPATLFTDPSRTIKVYIDGSRVMDSAQASVSPFYFGPVPLQVTYSEPTSYGSIGAIFVQGIGFVQPPLSVGTHTIELESESLVPPDPAFLNLSV
jgi:hypothetical protein